MLKLIPAPMPLAWLTSRCPTRSVLRLKKPFGPLCGLFLLKLHFRLGGVRPSAADFGPRPLIVYPWLWSGIAKETERIADATGKASQFRRWWLAHFTKGLIMSCIFEGYLNEAKELLAEAYHAAGNKARGMDFRDAARDIAFARGWELGPELDDTHEAASKEFDGLTMALLYMSNVQALHGLEPLGVMIGALEAGRRARTDEALAVSAGGDDVD